MLTAALIAAIVAAGFAAIWRITDPFNGNGPGTTEQPGFLAQGTPSLESPDGCPLTTDMFIVIDEEPFLGEFATLTPTTALVTADGDFVITCVNVEDPQPLLTGVVGAESLPWPGTVMLELEDGSAVAYNIATGQRIVLGQFGLVAAGAQTDLGSPWLATPNNVAYTDWRITNLETLESMILSEEIGGVLPDAYYPEFTWSPGSPLAIVAEGPDIGRTNVPNADDATTAELPGNALVVDGMFEMRRWIDTWGDIAISPDGAAIAFQETDPVGPLKVEDSRTGETLAEFPGFNVNARSTSRVAFSGDGESLVYLDGNDAWLATYTGEPTETLLETGAMRPSEVHATNVPGRVLISRITDEQIVTSVFDYNRTALSIVDTGTGNVINLEGVHVDYGYGIDDPWKLLRYVVTMSPSPDSDNSILMQLADIATGEVVLRSETIELSMDMPEDQFFQAGISNAGAVTVANVPQGPSILFLLEEDGVGMIDTGRLSDIEGYEGTYWFVAPSTDGNYLVVSGFQESTRSLFVTASTLSVDPTWYFPPTTIPVGVILAIPTEDDDDEPATLDAQDVTPLPASPVASPAG